MKAAALILALAASAAHADFMSGHELYERMQTPGAPLSSAQGYIMGVADATLGSEWCPPSTIKLKHVFAATQSYLEKLPDMRSEGASTFVIAAVSTYWPCGNKSKPKPKSANAVGML